jgi:hypothetical protein
MSFFQGTLQEGIGAALQQSKSVVCFVTGEGPHYTQYLSRTRQADRNIDGETESQQWEDEFFAEEEVSVLKGESLAMDRPLIRRLFLDPVAAAIPLRDTSSACWLTRGRISCPTLSHTEEANCHGHQVGSIVAID